MFSKTVLLAQIKTTAARITFLLGCIAVLALQGPGVARGQESDVRTELLSALALQSGVAESLGRADLTATLDEAIEQVELMSDADLVPLLGAIDELQAYSEALQTLDAAIQEAAAAGEAQSTGTSSVIMTAVPPPGLTAPAYFDDPVFCKFPVDSALGERNDTLSLLIALTTIQTAEDVVATADVLLAAVKWGCETIEFGFSISFLCAPLEIALAAAKDVLVIAKHVVDEFQRCDATVDEAHLDAAFFRAEDNFDLGVSIHDDLATHDTNIDADLAAHDAEMKALLATLQNSVDENQQKLTQIINLLLTPQGRRVGFPLH